MIPDEAGPRRSFLGAVSSAFLALLARRAGAATVPSRRPHRRVVTGVNTAGKSTIISDGPVPAEGVWVSPQGDADGADLWLLGQVPADLRDARDPIAGYKAQQWPSPGGVIARIVRWSPGFAIPMHRSATIDIGFAITGHIELLLEDGVTTLGPGDCVIQRGTLHGWRVVGDETYVGMAVLIDAKG